METKRLPHVVAEYIRQTGAKIITSRDGEPAWHSKRFWCTVLSTVGIGTGAAAKLLKPNSPAGIILAAIGGAAALWGSYLSKVDGANSVSLPKPLEPLNLVYTAAGRARVTQRAAATASRVANFLSGNKSS